MHLRRRLLALPALLALLCAASLAHAQGFPERQVTLIAPSAAGGPVDTMARILAEGLGRQWKQSVMVENRVGASGSIGAQAVAKARPDGYTLMLAYSGPIGQLEVMRPETPYRALRDFRPVGLIALAPVLVWARKDTGIADVAQLVARAKANPGKLSYATAGAGTTSHLAMELFQAAAGISLLHVPFSSAQAQQAFLGGHVDLLTMGAVGTFDPLEGSGRGNKLAVVASQRYSKAPEVPTMVEAGFKGANLDGWFGLMVPAGTPSEVVDKLERDFLAVMANPAVRAQIGATGADATPGNREVLQKMIRADIDNIEGLMKKVTIKTQ